LLRAIETRNAMSRLMNSYEVVVANAVSQVANYEASSATNLGLGFADWTAYDAAATVLGIPTGGNPWGTATNNPIVDVLNWKRAVSNQIGIRPNGAVIGTAVFDSLLTNPAILERIQFTTADSIDVDVLARYFGLERGIRVAEGRRLADSGELTPVFPENGMLLFYSPLSASESVMPAGGANAATPAFAYTYQLTGTPAVRPEYYIRERRVVRAEITVERAVNITGLGATGAFGSGFYIDDVFA
jgi:hypothetical protein